jgi:phosphoglycerate dehydrogenase-like enzyme
MTQYRMPKRLLIAAEADRALVERAKADARFDVVDHPVRTEDELAAIVGDCEVLVTRSYNRVTRRVIDAAPHLELIAQGTSGTDNIDAAAAAARGIAIINLPGANANAVAELVIGHIIALTRTVPAYTAEMRGGVWNRDDCATRHELRHYRLGIVGLGQVGSRVARYAAAFGMKVSAYDPYIGELPERVASLDELLRASDIVTLHVPLTDETRNMIGAAEMAAMPRGAILINAARGEVLETTAALAALGHLGGLALDVFDPEPSVRTWPDDPRLILTPHIAGCTHEARAHIGSLLWDRVLQFILSREDGSGSGA